FAIRPRPAYKWQFSTRPVLTYPKVRPAPALETPHLRLALNRISARGVPDVTGLVLPRRPRRRPDDQRQRMAHLPHVVHRVGGALASARRISDAQRRDAAASLAPAEPKLGARFPAGEAACLARQVGERAA